MKFDFTVEDREDGAYITNIVPNNELQIPLPCKVMAINDKPIKTAKEFHAAYRNAAEGDHYFMLRFNYNNEGNQYVFLRITE